MIFALVGGVYGVWWAFVLFWGEARGGGGDWRVGDYFGGEGFGARGLRRGKLVGNYARQTGRAEGDCGGGVCAGGESGGEREIWEVMGWDGWFVKMGQKKERRVDAEAQRREKGKNPHPENRTVRQPAGPTTLQEEEKNTG